MRLDADVSEANFHHFVQLLKHQLMWGTHITGGGGGGEY